MTIYNKAYYRKNRRRMLIATKKWQKKNPEKVKIAREKYDKQNPGWKNKYYQENQERLLRKNYERTQKLRRQVLEHYSGKPSKCKLCSYDKIECLDLDHIQGGGNKLRKENPRFNYYSWWKWIINNNYPKGFQVLCRNCNWLKHINNLKLLKYGRKKISF